MIAADLCKQQALDTDTKVIQQTNVVGNRDRAENTIIFLIIEETKQRPDIILNF